MQATPDDGFERFESARNNFGKFIYEFQPETKTLMWKLEKIFIKSYRQNLGGARGVREYYPVVGKGFEFKSWTRLITFHIALIPLGKVWIQLLSSRYK